jgi:protein gp37
VAEKTEISWTDSTFNPWIGCQKVSAGCDNCYAETLMDKRYHKVQWGPHGERKRTSAANWRQPIRWNKNATDFQAAHGHRQRVFCASLADVFDNQVDPSWRIDLFDLIGETEKLDWLLLTKRPENIAKMLPTNWEDRKGWSNVWLGTTCEDQAAYERRWPILSRIPCSVRFISYEPAIGPLTIRNHEAKPDWLICGGESGHGYRDMPASWANDIGWDCKTANVPFFMKQMAGKRPIPPSLMVRQFPINS